MAVYRKLDDRLTVTGAIWIVLLMYLGRQTIANDVVKVLCTKGIVKNEEVIYQYTKELEKHGLLKVVKVEKHKRGKPRILTANSEKLLDHLILCSMGEFSTEDRKTLSSLISWIVDVLDYYPEYLLASIGSKKISNLGLNQILSNFLFFSLEFIETCWQKINYPRAREPTVHDALKKWKELLKKGKITHDFYKMRENFVKTSFGLSSLVKDLPNDKVTKAASLMGDPHDLGKDTFAKKLLFVSIAVNDPHLAVWLDIYRKAC